jgi:hypothetical protein
MFLYQLEAFGEWFADFARIHYRDGREWRLSGLILPATALGPLNVRLLRLFGD